MLSLRGYIQFNHLWACADFLHFQNMHWLFCCRMHVDVESMWVKPGKQVCLILKITSFPDILSVSISGLIFFFFFTLIKHGILVKFEFCLKILETAVVPLFVLSDWV